MAPNSTWSANSNALPAGRKWPGGECITDIFILLAGLMAEPVKQRVTTPKLNTDGSAGRASGTTVLPAVGQPEALMWPMAFLYYIGGNSGGGGPTQTRFANFNSN